MYLLKAKGNLKKDKMITVYLKALKIHYISVLFEYNKDISLFPNSQ